MTIARRICLGIAGLCILITVLGLGLSSPFSWKPAAAIGSVCLAIGVGGVPTLAGYQFTAWILAAVVCAMIYPAVFLQIGPMDLGLFSLPAINLQNPWLILVIVQLVMFGMGTKMSLRDFAGVVQMPYPFAVGISLQFLVMPLTGYTLATMFGLPDEIAAGVVLIGSCSSGLASNVMCYLAGANLALSITLTSVATLLAPLVTPFWMQQLAGEMVEIEFVQMMLQIAKIVLIPIGAALLHDYLKHAPAAIHRSMVAGAMVCFLGLLASAFAYNAGSVPAVSESTRPYVEGGLLVVVGIVFAVGYHYLVKLVPVIDQQMHVVSMFGIIYFTTITTAAGRENLLVVGPTLILAAMLHNLVGYASGYGFSRLLRLDKSSALTVAFEVGMQNGGMASGLAGVMGKLSTVGLAPAVFSPWMNISGSVLANQVRRRWGNQIVTKEHDTSADLTQAH